MIFSIVTPSYNQGKFLAETIESVIGQEGDFEIDYIIVDGFSSDNSAQLIQRFDDLLKRGKWPIKCRAITFRWVSEKDRGQTEALMKGFRMARGEILAWLNSDDTYLPGALQTAATFFNGNPDAGLMYGNASYCDESGSTIGPYRTEPFHLERLAAANIICQPASFFRREAFENVGGLDEKLGFVMDYDLWIKIGRRFPCCHIQHLLATYRLHETSKTISNETLLRNSEESLEVTLKHFGWAPLTRVYTSCRIQYSSRLPGFLSRSLVLRAAAISACAIVRSIRLNQGLHRNDLKLLTRDNFSKLFKSRIEIMTGQPTNSQGSRP
jgi:glycosyltransferase involved in cell wall biosynthesis